MEFLPYMFEQNVLVFKADAAQLAGLLFVLETGVQVGIHTVLMTTFS